RMEYANAVMLVNGRIDELKLYKEALPADSILAHYNKPKGCVPMVIPCSTHTCDRRPTCRWHHREHGSGCYSLQINNSPDFTSPLIDAAVDDTAYAPSFDLPYGNIYWRVGSTEPVVSGFSLPDTFRVEAGGTGIAVPDPEGLKRGMISVVQLNGGIAVHYALERAGTVSLDLFSLAGSRVATSGEKKVAAGTHTLVLDGAKLLPAGSYCAILRFNGHSYTKKVALLR
ncbi:MAG: hypothetical protein JXA71_15780, partial [Chitinispirillaceae bacterium]|nr:hypothetical protein [Chitinispirillaceae bacterium]